LLGLKYNSISGWLTVGVQNCWFSVVE